MFGGILPCLSLQLFELGEKVAHAHLSSDFLSDKSCELIFVDCDLEVQLVEWACPDPLELHHLVLSGHSPSSSVVEGVVDRLPTLPTPVNLAP
jgi:hypothetical protein